MRARASGLSKALDAYRGARVLLTGHTGFKGSWISLWLHELGARVTGVALTPPTGARSMFDDLGIESEIDEHIIADIRDLRRLRDLVGASRPEFVFHLAAQSLVRPSYEAPLETLTTNVIGTANVLEALRLEGARCACVIVTSDKCYENREWDYGYRETDPMGGHDPYSMSKGAAELVTASWRSSFFATGDSVRVASARAGNVIGGGDWAKDRIVPDAARALSIGEPLSVRNPRSVRPWQHVIEPLAGYLQLGAALAGSDGASFAEGWNFGPSAAAVRSVGDLADCMVQHWGSGSWVDRSTANAPHEARLLRLSIEKAASRLDWHPRWGIDEAVARTVRWYRAASEGASPEQMRAISRGQIGEFLAAAG